MLIWILLVVAILVQLMLHFTDIGRNIYAVGGNATAARLAGIPLNRYIIGVYMLSGIVAALAGILLTARTGSGQPTSGSQGLELQSITAAALGGVALQGGRGTIVGTILAVILLGVLENGLIILEREQLLAGHRAGLFAGHCGRHPAAPRRHQRCRAAMSATLPMKAMDRIG